MKVDSERTVTEADPSSPGPFALVLQHGGRSLRGSSWLHHAPARQQTTRQLQARSASLSDYFSIRSLQCFIALNVGGGRLSACSLLTVLKTDHSDDGGL